MKYITPSILFAVLTLAAILLFLVRYALTQGGGDTLYEQLRPSPPQPLRFAGKRHPMERRDALAVLVITLVYALTAFLQLGDLSAPQQVCEFVPTSSYTVKITGSPVYTTGLRYFSGLGTGAYNVEVSPDGETWSTLWQRHDDPNDKDKVTGYYFADAAGYDPSYALTQKYNQLYKWTDITVENPQNVQYLRITGRADKQNLQLTRLCLLGQDGSPVSFSYGSVNEDGTVVEPYKEVDGLFSAQGVPEKSTWHNSTYFDEIYHARTAKEHIDGVYPYEVTHPPLGKLILGIGIRVFGMTPFGWRFMGTLLGVLMLPALYIFLKNMFGKTVVAACGTILFATDFMHLTQTRIATIDTYAVFFILLMYFFMYRYLTLPAGTPFSKGALPLALSGLMWGLGAASKWTVFYAGIGLAVVYFMGFYQKVRDWPWERLPERKPWIIRTLLFSVLCFVIVPFAIYTAAYIPYARALDVDLFAHSDSNGLALLFQNVWGKLTFTGEGSFTGQHIPQDNLLNIMANNQWYMFTYHQGVTDAHPYSSWWFQWLVDARPILYYMDNVYNAAGVMTHTTRFAAFANPVLCWSGLAAILICAAHAFRRLWAKAAFLGGMGVFAALLVWKVQHTPNGVFDPALSDAVRTRNLIILLACLALYLLLCALILRFIPGHSGKAAFILVGYLAQLVPWMFIGRTTFEYHYFPSLLFLVFAVSYLLDGLVERDLDWHTPVLCLTGFSVGLYVLFYPVLIGLQIPTWYEPLVKWIESWPF